MHDKQWGTEINSWKSQGTTAESKTWAYSSTKLTTPRSIFTAATADRTTISYNPYLYTHGLTKVNTYTPKPKQHSIRITRKYKTMKRKYKIKNPIKRPRHCTKLK
jgi:hypothetical protein